ncbi:NAP1-related protein [Trifolium repens]|nr:NAP1-related protein [Trifolium repens]
MVSHKNKKLKAFDKSESAEELDGELVLSIEKLQEIQDELEKINEEASDKALEIKHEYNKIRKPVYDKRNDLIKSIPNFWSTAFLIHPALGDLLNKKDRKIFKHLSSLEVEDHKDAKSGFSITFNFNPNPYFENTKIGKTFTFLEEGTTKVISTPIKWKAGKEIPSDDISFFSWFSDHTVQKDDMDDMHDEIAQIIKDDLWPNPLDHFHNEDPNEADEGEDVARGFEEEDHDSNDYYDDDDYYYDDDSDDDYYDDDDDDNEEEE